MPKFIPPDPDEADEETKQLMKDYDLEPDQAERVLNIMDDWGVDEQDAVDIEEELGDEF